MQLRGATSGLVAATALAALLTGIGAAGASPAGSGATITPKSREYGAWERFSNIEYNHAVLKVNVSAPKPVPDKLVPPYHPRPKHGRLVYVHVVATGIKGKSSMSPLDFRLITPKGQKIKCDFGGVRHQLSGDSLTKGHTSSGNVAFHLGPKNTIAKIAFTNAIGTVAGYWHH